MRIARDAVKLAQTPTEGVFVNDMKNHRVVVSTKNTQYRLIIDRHGNVVCRTIPLNTKGEDRFPTPTPINIHGSTWGGSMLKLGYIGVGMHLEFDVNEKTYVTSEIQSLNIYQDPVERV